MGEFDTIVLLTHSALVPPLSAALLAYRPRLQILEAEEFTSLRSQGPPSRALALSDSSQTPSNSR
jgi:hypothetical protein